MKNGHLRILNDSDGAGRGRKRDEEEGGQGGRSDEARDKMKNLLENEKVA